MSQVPGNAALHPDLAANPILARWITVEADGSVTVNAGKVELGQGIGIVQLQVAAEELDVPLARMRLRAGDTAHGPDQGYTSGSLSTQVGVIALRQACAEVRARFVAQAALALGVRPDEIEVRAGVLSNPASGAQRTYADLREAVDLNVQATGLASPKRAHERTLTGMSARHVLQEVAAISGWAKPKAAALRTDAVRGRGLGFARYKGNGAYCAVVIEIEVTDRIALDRIWAIVDAGELLNPDGVVNQIEGGILQAASWTLKESLGWNETGITARTWDDYPILRFDEAPQLLCVHCVPAPDEPPLGVGECAAGPTAAAIGNALADALGVRMRDLPLTPERLAAAALETNP